MTRPGPLADRIALVTGSTRGLGLAAAHRLAASGCGVVLHGLDAPSAADAARRAIEDEHQVRTMYVQADLREPARIEGLFDSATGTLGSIDVLVNNAVVRHASPVEAFRPEEWDEALAVNLSAAFHTIRLALPGMKQRGWGRIVNVSSIYGVRGAINRVGYVTTKTALIGLTRAVALETASLGITCNAVCPGTSATPVHEATVSALMEHDGLSRLESERRVLQGKQPSGRFVGADQVAALIAFLCGPDASDITGAVLPVDGGWSAT